MLNSRVAAPTGIACVAVLAAGLPAMANDPDPAADDGKTSNSSGPDATPAAYARQNASGKQNANAIKNLSVENVADFVAVRVRHKGGYWDGKTDIELSVGGKSGSPYRISVSRGDGELTLERKGNSKWSCSDATASAPDANDETLVRIPRSCFDGKAGKVSAEAEAHAKDGNTSKASTGNVKRTKKPNVVVIMSDDMRDDELDGPWMERTRESIGDAGVRFQNSFASLPLCAPARASFLTGQYPHNHGVWSHAKPYGFSVFRDQETLPVWLNRAGYHNFMIGKYINGYGKDKMPAPDGSKSSNYVPPGWDDWRGSLDGNGTYSYSKTHLNNNGKTQSLAGSYQTNAYRKIATNQIRKRAKSNNPFFMYLSFTAPHHGGPREKDDPKDVVDHNGDKYRLKTPARPKRVEGKWNDDIPRAPGAGAESDMSDKPSFMQRLPGLTQSERDGIRNLARQRAEALGLLDRAVAQTVKQLKSSGQLDNTYVIFTSDNGYFLGEHRMREGKVLPYEPSLRTPTIMRGPGIPAGQERQDPFLSIDFAPTILKMAGQSTDQKIPIDGKSMLGVAQDGDNGWSRPVLTETGPATVPTLMDLSGDTVGGDPNDESKASRMRGLRVPGYLYTETSGREPELYDLGKDPGQVSSAIGDDGLDKVQQTMQEIMKDLRACVGEECRASLPKKLRGD